MFSGTLMNRMKLLLECPVAAAARLKSEHVWCSFLCFSGCWIEWKYVPDPLILWNYTCKTTYLIYTYLQYLSSIPGLHGIYIYTPPKDLIGTPCGPGIRTWSSSRFLNSLLVGHPSYAYKTYILYKFFSLPLFIPVVGEASLSLRRKEVDLITL